MTTFAGCEFIILTRQGAENFLTITSDDVTQISRGKKKGDKEFPWTDVQVDLLVSTVYCHLARSKVSKQPKESMWNAIFDELGALPAMFCKFATLSSSKVKGKYTRVLKKFRTDFASMTRNMSGYFDLTEREKTLKILAEEEDTEISKRESRKASSEKEAEDQLRFARIGLTLGLKEKLPPQ